MTVAREDTLQQLDPLGSLGARAIALVAGGGVLVLACVRTIAQRDELESELLAVLALVALSIAVAHLAARSGSLRVPIGRGIQFTVLALALIALILNAASMWHAGQQLREDWGPAAVGMLCLAMSPYRPARDLVIGGVLAAVVAAHVALLQAEHEPGGVPAALQVGVTVTPILALSLGSAVFVGTLIAFTKRWEGESSQAVREFVRARLGGLTRSVQQDRVSILNRDVVPFFEDLLNRKNVTEQDRAQASAIAERIRLVMVAEVDRSWLDIVVATDPASSGSVHDPHRHADEMSTEQRTALRAAIIALFDEPTFVPGSLDIHIAGEGGKVSMSCSFTGHDPARRPALAPYFSVLRVVFTDLAVDFAPPALTLRFIYDQR